LDILALIALGAAAGAGAGLLAGLIGIGGGIVVVPVVYYGLLSSGVPPDEAVHVAVATSLAAILPAAIVSFLAHRRAGNTDCAFLCEWGPGIATGVVAAQFAAPHVRGSLMTATFALLCLVFAVRFAFPQRFRPLAERPPGGAIRHFASAGIGLSSGFAGIGGGILTNIVMTLSGFADAQEHRSGSRSGRRRERASHNCGGARIESEPSAGARQHRHHDLDLHCPGPSCRGLAWCATSPDHVRGAFEPRLRHGPVSDRGHYVALEPDLN
jgi:uncharacterized membrane protein YfcA